LVLVLEDWFVKNRFNKNKWNNNEVGKIIKRYIMESNNWKNAPRGNPKRGGIKSSENKRNNM
jgi:hypothetical protein